MEVEEVLPELVSEDEDGYKGIEYGKLTAVLVEAIQEQQSQIAALLDRVAQLELQASFTTTASRGQPTVVALR